MKLSAKQALCGLLLVFLASFALGAAAWLCLLPWGVTDGLWTGQALGTDQAADQIFSHRDAGAKPINASLIFESPFDESCPERGLWKLFGTADDFKPGWLLAGGRELEFIADQGRYFTVLVSQDHRLGNSRFCLDRFHCRDLVVLPGMLVHQRNQAIQISYFAPMILIQNIPIFKKVVYNSAFDGFPGPVFERNQPWQIFKTGEKHLIAAGRDMSFSSVQHPCDALQGPRLLTFGNQITRRIINPSGQFGNGGARIREQQGALNRNLQLTLKLCAQHEISPLDGHRMPGVSGLDGPIGRASNENFTTLNGPRIYAAKVNKSQYREVQV